jgi:hypothetical protein
MAIYTIALEDEPKVVSRLEKGEVFELELMDEGTKQWWKAKLKVFREGGKKRDLVKVLGQAGAPPDREYYAEIIEKVLPED